MAYFLVKQYTVYLQVWTKGNLKIYLLITAVSKNIYNFIFFEPNYDIIKNKLKLIIRHFIAYYN